MNTDAPVKIDSREKKDAAAQPDLGTKAAPNRLNMVFAPSAFERLLTLSAENGVKPVEIIRRALSVYSYIMAARRGHEATTRVLLDRGDGHPSELILPV